MPIRSGPFGRSFRRMPFSVVVTSASSIRCGRELSQESTTSKVPGTASASARMSATPKVMSMSNAVASCRARSTARALMSVAWTV